MYICHLKESRCVDGSGWAGRREEKGGGACEDVSAVSFLWPVFIDMFSVHNSFIKWTYTDKKQLWADWGENVVINVLKRLRKQENQKHILINTATGVLAIMCLTELTILISKMSSDLIKTQCADEPLTLCCSQIKLLRNIHFHFHSIV